MGQREMVQASLMAERDHGAYPRRTPHASALDALMVNAILRGQSVICPTRAEAERLFELARRRAADLDRVVVSVSEVLRSAH